MTSTQKPAAAKANTKESKKTTAPKATKTASSKGNISADVAKPSNLCYANVVS